MLFHRVIFSAFHSSKTSAFFIPEILSQGTFSSNRSRDHIRFSTTHAESSAIHLSFKEFLPSHVSSTPIAKHPVVILHGLFGSKTNWQFIARTLSVRLGQKIITVDARNHGDSPHDPDHSYESMVEDVVYLLDELHLPKVILVGHSMGGKTAMCIALQKPARVESVIIVDCAPSASPGSKHIRTVIDAMKNFDTNRSESLPRQKARAMKEFEKSVPELKVRQFIVTNLVERDGKVLWRINLSAFEKHMEDILGFPVYHNFFGLPALFIVGAKSNYVTDAEIPGIKQLFPKAEFIVISGAGHWVHSEKPNEVINVIKTFLVNKEDQ